MKAAQEKAFNELVAFLEYLHNTFSDLQAAYLEGNLDEVRDAEKRLPKPAAINKQLTRLGVLLDTKPWQDLKAEPEDA